MSDSLRRNPFWQIIQDDLPKYGFPKFHAVAGKNNWELVIEGLHHGKPSTIKYIFPRICRSLESTANFRSKLRAYVQRYFPTVNFTSADPRFQEPPERKSTFIAHINHDKPKKVLDMPNSMKVEFANVAETNKAPQQVLVMPYIPDSYVGDRIMPRKNPNEPVSDTMVLVMYLMHSKDVSTVTETLEGTAKFRGSKPAPLRVLGTATPPPVAEPVAEPVVPATNYVDLSAAPPPVALTTNVVVLQPRHNAQAAIIQRILSNPTKIWTPSELKDLVRTEATLGATLSLLTTAKKIQRIGRGQYQAPKVVAKKKVVKRKKAV